MILKMLLVTTSTLASLVYDEAILLSMLRVLLLSWVVKVVKLVWLRLGVVLSLLRDDCTDRLRDHLSSLELGGCLLLLGCNRLRRLLGSSVGVLLASRVLDLSPDAFSSPTWLGLLWSRRFFWFRLHLRMLLDLDWLRRCHPLKWLLRFRCSDSLLLLFWRLDLSWHALRNLNKGLWVVECFGLLELLRLVWHVLGRHYDTSPTCRVHLV